GGRVVRSSARSAATVRSGLAPHHVDPVLVPDVPDPHISERLLLGRRRRSKLDHELHLAAWHRIATCRASCACTGAAEDHITRELHLGSARANQTDAGCYSCLDGRLGRVWIRGSLSRCAMARISGSTCGSSANRKATCTSFGPGTRQDGTR